MPQTVGNRRTDSCTLPSGLRSLGATIPTPDRRNGRGAGQRPAVNQFHVWIQEQEVARAFVMAKSWLTPYANPRFTSLAMTFAAGIDDATATVKSLDLLSKTHSSAPTDAATLAVPDIVLSRSGAELYVTSPTASEVDLRTARLGEPLGDRIRLSRQRAALIYVRRARFGKTPSHTLAARAHTGAFATRS